MVTEDKHEKHQHSQYYHTRYRQHQDGYACFCGELHFKYGRDIDRGTIVYCIEHYFGCTVSISQRIAREVAHICGPQNHRTHTIINYSRIELVIVFRIEVYKLVRGACTSITKSIIFCTNSNTVKFNKSRPVHT